MALLLVGREAAFDDRHRAPEILASLPFGSSCSGLVLCHRNQPTTAKSTPRPLLPISSRRRVLLEKLAGGTDSPAAERLKARDSFVPLLFFSDKFVELRRDRHRDGTREPAGE